MPIDVSAIYVSRRELTPNALQRARGTLYLRFLKKAGRSLAAAGHGRENILARNGTGSRETVPPDLPPLEHALHRAAELATQFSR